MIPAIGYMIGFYIITRMFSMLLKKPDGSESNVTLILAAITIFVAVIALVVLFTSELGLLDLEVLK